MRLITAKQGKRGENKVSCNTSVFITGLMHTHGKVHVSAGLQHAGEEWVKRMRNSKEQLALDFFFKKCNGYN